MTCKKKKACKQAHWQYPQQRQISVFNDASAPLIKQEFKSSQVPLNSTICSRREREEQVLSAALHTHTRTPLYLLVSNCFTAARDPQLLCLFTR